VTVSRPHRVTDQPDVVVRLLGDGEVLVGGVVPTAMTSARLRSLLALLVLARDRPVGRKRLAFSFWPESSEGQARTNLRQALHHLRRALGDSDVLLRVDNHTVQWIGGASADVDVVRFEEAARIGLEQGDESQLRCAAELYRADLLDSCCDEWALPERQRLRTMAGAVFAALLDSAWRRGDSTRAIQLGDRLLRHDPLDESTYRRLMAIHAASGDRARAVRVYHDCAAVLDRELAVVPDPATVMVYRAIAEQSDRATGAQPVPIVEALLHRSDPTWGELTRFLPTVAIAPASASDAGEGASRRSAEAIARLLLESDRPMVLPVRWCDGESMELPQLVLRLARQSSLTVPAPIPRR
jgi:DNA-binding SARP family transcriptional activator